MSDINFNLNKCASKLYTLYFISYIMVSVAVHKSEKQIEIAVKSKFWKAQIFECTKFMYLDLITDMPNIDSEISQPIDLFNEWTL